jgi:hypothetical protein
MRRSITSQYATAYEKKDDEYGRSYSRPPYSDKQQPPPGSEEEMSPKVDYGESSYHGTGRLKDCSALVTGADSGSDQASYVTGEIYGATGGHMPI